MTDQKPTTSIEEFLRQTREFVAAGIAIGIILSVLVFVGVAFTFIDPNSTDRMSQVKDLLGMVLPLVTFVLGYYFNKTSTEARAENAERTAQAAVTTAQVTTQERNQAMANTESAMQKVSQFESTLGDVLQLADDMIAQTEAVESGLAPGGGPGTLAWRGEEDEAARAQREKQTQAWNQSKRELQVALAMARKVLK